VLIERMSPGLFWAEMYDSFRIVLRDARSNDADDVRLALTTYALSDAARRGRRVAQCLAEEQHIPALERFGFANLGRVMEFGAHRSMNREMTAQLIAIFERVSRRGRALDDCSGDSNE
jgi:hypothetical protein